MTKHLSTIALLSVFAFCLSSCTKKSEVPTTASTPAAHDHAAAPAADGGFEAAPDTAKVFFENLKDGQTVEKKFTAKFGLQGMLIHPAGALIAGTGHHHLIVNGAAIPEGQVVPTDETHIHYGLGQTEAELELPAGKHTLTLQFANGAHVSYGPKMSATVEINVK